MLKHSLTWTQMDIASLLGLLAKVVIIIPLDYAMDTLSSTVDLEPTIWSVCLPNFYLILGQSAHFCWSSLLWAHVVFFSSNLESHKDNHCLGHSECPISRTQHCGWLDISFHIQGRKCSCDRCEWCGATQPRRIFVPRMQKMNENESHLPAKYGRSCMLYPC